MAVTRARNRTGRSAIAWVAAAFVVLASARAARADHADPKLGVARGDGGDIGFSLNADVECSPLPTPGRVQCLVRLRPVGGTLHFGDVIVLSAPPFAPAMRDRVAVRDAKRSDSAGTDLPLTLAATRDGDGELYVMGRATICSERRCRPVQAEATARVVVGSPSVAP